MVFKLQLPGSADLAQAIDDAAAGARSGGGIFAFASKAGVAHLASLPKLSKLLKSGKRFDIIVGTDAITNAAAVVALQQLHKDFKGFRPLAFVHDQPATFHPKFCWFEHKDGIRLLIGSGNLTLGGLGPATNGPREAGNWEAFSDIWLSVEDGDEALKTIKDWIADQVRSGNLLELGNPEVLARAVANSRVRLIRTAARRQPTPAGPAATPAASVAAVVSAAEDVSASLVFIRELSNNRSGQADVTQPGLAFFGFEGEPTTALIQYVGLDNVVGEAVERLLFVNASQNYRIEIREISEQDDSVGPDDQRMALVAIKLAEKAFRYTIVPVTSEHYQSIDSLLGPLRKRPRRMRQKFLTVAELLAEWKDAPSKLLPIATIPPENVD